MGYALLYSSTAWPTCDCSAVRACFDCSSCAAGTYCGGPDDATMEDWSAGCTSTFKSNEAPFDIQSIYHDDKFTYIKTNAPEKFSVYEMRDGKPNLINYDLREGTYIIPKVMDNGYVELGKKKMEFTRKG